MLSDKAGHKHPIDERVNILGVCLDPMTVGEAVRELSSWIRDDIPGYANFCSVNSIMECFSRKELKQLINQGLVLTDGMPLVWLCRLLGKKKAERVYGPDLMLALCQYGTDKGFRHFFYGGTLGRAEQLADNLTQQFPGLIIVGTHSPGRLEIGEMETQTVINTINNLQPDVIWIGLGTPKQDIWMAKHRHLLNAPVLAAVGAAFDFHSGSIRQAPAWMQKNGLEWLFRLFMEPRRLGFRYLVYNPAFILSLILQFTKFHKF